MDMSLIGALANSLNTATGIAKALSELRLDTAVMTRTIEIKLVLSRAVDQVADLQAAANALKSRVAELEKEVLRLTAFPLELERYVCKAVGPGAHAYVEKELADKPEEAPWLCVHCCDKRIKSILQFSEYKPGRRIFVCPECKTQVVVPIPSAGVTIETTGPRRSIYDDYTR